MTTRLDVGRGTLVGLLFLMVGSVAQAQTAPDKLVKDVANDVLKSLREDPDLRTSNPTKMAELIEQKVAPHFDFERMTRLAVGRNWREANDEELERMLTQATQAGRGKGREDELRN